jgi:flagellar hook-associated protein FlgK
MENPFDLLMDKLNNIEQQLKELRELHKQEFKDELMNINQLGDYINYQKTSIYGLVQKRKIPFIKASGKLDFLINEIH